MKILSIETSCDDTGVAIFSAQGGPAPGWNVLSNIVASQIEVHKKYGGVYPALAKREHQKNLIPTIKTSLEQAKLLVKNLKLKNQNYNSKIKIIEKILEREPELYKKLIPFLKKYNKPDIDLISVTNGPGLEPCLWVGVNFAKALSYFWNIPIVAVNHVESHILVNFAEHEALNMKQIFPAICLVVSGGHTQIILMTGIGKYKILGETRDDAAGECFDKCAKILGLGYPGGPIISSLASKMALSPTSSKLAKLPRPMIGTKDYDFSFSGLKTAVLYADRKIKHKTQKYKMEMAAEIQQAIIDVLLKKTIKAAKDYKAKSIILGGGVSANTELRKQFTAAATPGVDGKTPGVKVIFPPSNLSTDNGLMTAITGFYHKKDIVDWQDIRADGNLRISK